MGTNIDGKRKVTIAMTAIKGVGRRYANIVLKKADVDLTKRAGECTDEEVTLFFTVFVETFLLNCCFLFLGGKNCNHYFESTTIQNSKLVP